jgi:aryl-alcohol dehydrogenase-like predicted oxidoreductase
MAMKRCINQHDIYPIGLGCMGLSHAYGIPPDKHQAERVLLQALDLGVNHFDTAALYGFGKNESLLGDILKQHRQKIFLTSKCGMTGVDGKRVIDGRPETLKKTCDEALQRLQTDVIDLYYLHRLDKTVPLEDSVGALVELIDAGKIQAIGLSEVSAETLRKVHRMHPVAALQTEYSLWTRNPEIATLEACRELNIAFVAFSPLGRGVLANSLPTLEAIHRLEANDLRRNMPRFQTEHWQKNVQLLTEYIELANQANCTPAQLALAWLLQQGDHICPIPGTTNVTHLEENCKATEIKLSADIIERVERLINQDSISGARYNTATQQEINTEAFYA